MFGTWAEEAHSWAGSAGASQEFLSVVSPHGASSWASSGGPDFLCGCSWLQRHVSWESSRWTCIAFLTQFWKSPIVSVKAVKRPTQVQGGRTGSIPWWRRELQGSRMNMWDWKYCCGHFWKLQSVTKTYHRCWRAGQFPADTWVSGKNKTIFFPSLSLKAKY